MQTRLTILFLLAALVACGQMRIDPIGPVNAASYIPSGLPMSGIAQGGIFIVKGFDLAKAPANPNNPCVNASAFPLPTTLEGVSITIRMGATPISAYMIYVCARLRDADGYIFDQLAAVLPSSTPVGTGTITVSNQGRTVSGSVKVVSSAPGIFTLNQSGRGPGVITDAVTYAVNTVTNSFRPGQWATLWMTGLGPLPQPSRDDLAPPVGNLNVPIEVYVGGQRLASDMVNYWGRAPGYPGLDQVNFRPPAGLSGCSIPVFVKIGTMMSNTVTMSLGDTRRCSDPVSMSAAQMDAIDQNRNVGHAIIMLNRTQFKLESVDNQGKVNATSGILDVGYGRFYQYHPAHAYRSQEAIGPPALGQCIVTHNHTSTNDNLDDLIGVSRDPVPHNMLDAGPNVNINGGAAGVRQLLAPAKRTWQDTAPNQVSLKYVNKSKENAHMFIDTLENFSADNRVPPGGERVINIPWAVVGVLYQVKFNAGRNGQVLDSATWRVRPVTQLLVLFDEDEDLYVIEGTHTVPQDQGLGDVQLSSAYFKILGMRLDGEELDPDLKIPAPFLQGGNYTATTQGTSQLGAINQTIQVPATHGLTWQQRDTVNVINRSQNYLVTWTGGDPNREHVVIYGQSSAAHADDAPRPVSSFICSAPIGPGQFSIPAVILSQLPPSKKQKDGILSFGVAPLNNVGNFTTTGIQTGAFRYTINYLRSVTYQ